MRARLTIVRIGDLALELLYALLLDARVAIARRASTTIFFATSESHEKDNLCEAAQFPPHK